MGVDSISPQTLRSDGKLWAEIDMLAGTDRVKPLSEAVTPYHRLTRQLGEVCHHHVRLDVATPCRVLRDLGECVGEGGECTL